MNRIKPVPLAVATTVRFLMVSVACSMLVSLFPDWAVNFFNAWFHGLDLNLLKPPGGKTLTIAQFAMGAIGVVVVAFLARLVLAATYDVLMARTKSAS